MVSLEDLQQYCVAKEIIIVGNSSRLFNSRYRKLIDKYDIVVRINRGYKPNQNLYTEYFGTKTNILSLGVKSAVLASNIIQNNDLNYILSPIIHSDRLDYVNVYDVEREVYDSLRQSLGGFKPSTGISTYNFFNRFIDFARLDLIGFDFFESSTRERNQLGHLYVDDHHGIKEMKFFESSHDPEKTKLHKITGSNASVTPHPDNIPRYNTVHQYNIKNNMTRR